MDAFAHIGWASKSSEEFDKRSRQPLIKAFNYADTEPKSHPNSITLQLEGKLNWSDYWQLEDWNSKTGDEFNKRAAHPWMTASNEADEQPREYSLL